MREQHTRPLRTRQGPRPAGVLTSKVLEVAGCIVVIPCGLQPRSRRNGHPDGAISFPGLAAAIFPELPLLSTWAESSDARAPREADCGMRPI